MACVCGSAAVAGGTHALVYGALWHTVVARHNVMVDAWRRVFSRAGISSSLEPHVKQLPQLLRAVGLPVLPSRPTGSHHRDGTTMCATLTTSELPASPALAVPSTFYGTQASPSATPPATAPPPRLPPQCASDLKTCTSEVSHPHYAPVHTTRVAVLADGLLAPGCSPRRRRRRRCHRSCHYCCQHRGHSRGHRWHGHSHH